MRKTTLFTLDTPYREPLSICAAEFGAPDAPRSIAVVGSTRGNEIQQTFICAQLIERLSAAEERGLLAQDARILVIPSANPFSMNIGERFWPVDHTDINRMFPGYDAGETTQRIAAGLFEAVKDCDFGISLGSYYLPGDFLTHVRVTHANAISDEALKLADAFGFPYVVSRMPSSFDTTTLNYNWQVWNTHAFTVLAKETDTINQRTATYVQNGILRFMNAMGFVQSRSMGGSLAVHIDESDLVDMRSENAGGFFLRNVESGERVVEGQTLAVVADGFDGHVRETLRAPVTGYVFFSHTAPLINQYTIAFKLVPEVA